MMAQPRTTVGRATSGSQAGFAERYSTKSHAAPGDKKKGNQDEYERFLSSTSALWTVIDQQRLNALHGLHQRMLEYHNNIHVKGLVDSYSSISESIVDASSDLVMVAQAIKFSADRAEKAASICMSDMAEYFRKTHQEYNDPARQGFVWIHLRDACAIDIAAKTFDIHDVLVAGMHDLRAHSSFLPGFNEFLVTYVICMRENNDFNMYKMYIYVSKHVVITFQAELLPDIMDPELSSPDKLVEPLFDNYLKLRSKCLKYGSLYLFYEIALHTVRSMDSAMEFVSYSLSYFNQVVHLRLLHRERLNITIKMHMISASILFFKNLIDEANGSSMVLLQAQLQHSAVDPKGYCMLLTNDLLSEKHIPYLADLADSFSFVLICLTQQLDESSRLEKEMDATMQLRTSNTSIVLSLIATIFLPLTFFAGVFGMNFTVDAGYTIGMLNSKAGPVWFYAMCLVSALGTVAFFISQGWLESGPFGKLYKNLMGRNRIDDSRFDFHEQEALERAEQEELRRKEEADARRSFSNFAKSVERTCVWRSSFNRHSASVIRSTVQQSKLSTSEEKTAGSPLHLSTSPPRGSVLSMASIPERSESADSLSAVASNGKK